MNLILLSGGSGKRLWPLSNEARSKQFLRILPSETGNESMLQRVYRQIRESGISAPLVITTSESQIDSIRSQLGNNVEIVTEPERRDTFPAIALASAYLWHEKKCSKNEVVVVLPVDPYTELGYFETLRRMAEAVEGGAADLVLMGIQPTYPSEKYGYIITEENQEQEPKLVKRFIEKPNEKTAQNLIEKGAVWNGGVFAFKLGFMIDILNDHIQTGSFAELREHYTELKKTSFDYEVVEKANSIAMVSYCGLWKDLGTWNTLAEEIDSDQGLVLKGEGAESTRVINELDIPVLVLGATDLVVAASPDGILVTSKHASSHMKPYVESFCHRPMYEERRWGTYKVLDYTTYRDDIKSLTKHLFINAGKCISYQTHQNRDEIWTIVDGTGVVLLDGHTRNIRRGDVAYITAGMKHAIKACEDLHIVEVQVGKELAEDDIERYEYEW